MNELKPEDVMRALDKLKYGGHSCHDCKYAKWSGEDRCGLNGCRIAKAALALLREKDAEIERLKAHNKELDNLCNLMHQKLDEGYAEFANEERAEAINEFAERLKKYYDALKSGLVSYHIDQIAKEMREKT